MLYISIAIILIIIILYTILTYNTLAKLKIRVNEAFSTMDIYLKKRWDLIPNLTEIVKEYAKHEKELFTSITKIRTSSYESMSFTDKMDKNNEINETLNKMMLIAENYPELKASENFINLSNELSKIEDEIASSRKYYNATIRNLNNKIVTFPSSIVAKIFHFEKQKMYEINFYEKQNSSINI